MFGALIGAGASLLGGLFGGKSKKQETTTTSHVDYGRMVREAEAAGFNPLTALRNGGAAGFSVSTGTTPATPLSARIADGVSGAAQTFLANFDPFKDQQRETEFKLVEAQLANLNADTALKQRTGLGSVPTFTGGNIKRTMGAGVGHNQKFKSVADALPASSYGFRKTDVPDLADYVPNMYGTAQPNFNPLASQPAETKRPQRVNPYPSWTGLERNPYTAGAEAAEDGLGENVFVSTLNSVSEIGHDIAWNGYRVARHLNGEYQKTAALTRKSMAKNKDSRKGWEIGRDVISGIWQSPLLSPRKKKQ